MGQKVSKWVGEVITEAFPNPNKIVYNWKHTEFINILDDMKLATKQVGKCQFKSSHNSVVGDVQIFGPASINCLAKLLNQGVRAIELDVFESQKKEGFPVVSHGNLDNNLQVTSAVDLEVCLKYIRDYAWTDTNEPLFIFFEMNIDRNDNKTLLKMYELLIEYLADRVFIGTEDMYTIPLARLVGKVVIVPSVRTEMFKFLTKISLYGGMVFLNRSGNEAPVESASQLIRVYAENVFLSNNPNALLFLRKGNQFVCMNWTYEDNHLKEYKLYFRNKGVL